MSLLITFTVLYENWLIILLHVTSSHCCTQFLFLISCLSFHSSFRPSITDLSVFSPNTFCTHFAITSYSYWFYSSVMKFTFLLDFFEHLPPCHQAVGVTLDGVTSRVCILILFFPLDLSFNPRLHCTRLLLSFLLEYGPLHVWSVSIVCLYYCIWNFTFLYPLDQNVCSNICVCQFCWYLFCCIWSYIFHFLQLIQFLFVHLIVSSVFVLFVLNSCFHKRELLYKLFVFVCLEVFLTP